MVWKIGMNPDNLVPGCVSLGLALVVGIGALAQPRQPEALAVTPSELSWMSQGPLAAPGMEQVNLVGNPLSPGPYTLRLKFPPNYRVPPHWHAVLEHVTVLSGTLNVGMGEQPTYSGGTALSAGSYAVMPQKMVHYAWTGSDGVVFQLHSVGPWSITYVNPKDDPRQARP